MPRESVDARATRPNRREDKSKGKPRAQKAVAPRGQSPKLRLSSSHLKAQSRISRESHLRENPYRGSPHNRIGSRGGTTPIGSVQEKGLGFSHPGSKLRKKAVLRCGDLNLSGGTIPHRHRGNAASLALVEGSDQNAAPVDPAWTRAVVPRGEEGTPLYAQGGRRTHPRPWEVKRQAEENTLRSRMKKRATGGEKERNLHQRH